MPWKHIKPMDQRKRLIYEYSEYSESIAELGRKYEVSRKTVYKWLVRYEKEGVEGLKDKSKRPKYHPQTTDERLINRILTEKHIHKYWGPKKIIAFLKNKHPLEKWPAPSTAGEWLKKAGLTGKRKFRKRVPPYSEPFLDCKKPNDVWSADYKGQFKTRDNRNCYPLTISDNNSRYLLACQGLYGPRYEETKDIFRKTFIEYGVPYAIRIDNGTPFATRSIAGLSRLSLWWIRLGIVPERITKGSPQENGRHERMHRTLKQETVNPKAKNIKQQQLRFNRFKEQYNEERPHEALGQTTPANSYRRSNREFKETLKPVEYDQCFEVRNIRHNGEMRFKGKYYFLSELLAHQRVGLKEIDDGKWQIYFSFQPIAMLNQRYKMIEPMQIKGKKCNPCFRFKV